MKKLIVLALITLAAVCAHAGTNVSYWNQPGAPATALFLQSDNFVVGVNQGSTNIRFFNFSGTFSVPAGKTAIAGWINETNTSYNTLVAALVTAQTQGKITVVLYPKANCTEDSAKLLNCYEIFNVDLVGQ